MSFATTLAKNFRKHRGKLSQAAFAKKLGVSTGSVARIELAEQNVTIKTLEQLCEKLKCTPNDLLEDNPCHHSE